MVVFRRAFPLSSFWICVYINIEITHISRRWGTPQNLLLPFIDDLWKTRKMRILKKWKKNCWRYHHFTNVYQKPQSWGTVPEIRSDTFFLSFRAIFCPNNPKTQNFEKTKKSLEISFYTCVPQMTIIWCMVPEISSAIDRIICHFRLFFALLPP